MKKSKAMKKNTTVVNEKINTPLIHQGKRQCYLTIYIFLLTLVASLENQTEYKQKSNLSLEDMQVLVKLNALIALLKKGCNDTNIHLH